MSFSSSSLTIIGKIKRSVGLPDGSRTNFPSLFDAWNEDPNNPTHNYMADYYGNAIIAGLKEYASSIIDLTGF